MLISKLQVLEEICDHMLLEEKEKELSVDLQFAEMKRVVWLICNLCKKDAILSIEDIVQWCYGVTNMHKCVLISLCCHCMLSSEGLCREPKGGRGEGDDPKVPVVVGKQHGKGTPKPPLPTWMNVALPSELTTRPKLMLPRKARPKDIDLASLDPTLAACFPTVGVTIGASPTAIALALTHQLRQQMRNSKRASDSIALTTSKKAKRISNANPEEGVVAAKAHIFRRLEQMITALNLQPLEGTRSIHLLQSVAYHSFQAQLAHVRLHDTIKALTKDFELLKAAKAAHSKEVKGLKTVMAKKLAEDLKSTEEDALKEFKDSERSPGPISPDDANVNASVDIAGDAILMDNAYLNSSANLDSVVGMDHAPVLTLAEDDQGDAVATEEEHPLLSFN
nr:hypothetical protein Iba_chr13bCG8560 [Ipomoea batatas]